jgi:hypothetical protein
MSIVLATFKRIIFKKDSTRPPEYCYPANARAIIAVDKVNIEFNWKRPITMTVVLGIPLHR